MIFDEVEMINFLKEKNLD